MKALLDENGFDRRPHNVAPDFWFYEEPDGLHVYFRQQGHSAGLVGIIKWRKVEATLRRKQAGRKRFGKAKR